MRWISEKYQHPIQGEHVLVAYEWNDSLSVMVGYRWTMPAAGDLEGFDGWRDFWGDEITNVRYWAKIVKPKWPQT